MFQVFNILPTYLQLQIGAVHCDSIFGGCCEYALRFSPIEYDTEFICIAFAHSQQLADTA